MLSQTVSHLTSFTCYMAFTPWDGFVGCPPQGPNQLCRPCEDPEPCLSVGGSSRDWGPGSRSWQDGVVGDGSNSLRPDHHDGLGLLSSFLRNGGANMRGGRRGFERQGACEKCPGLVLERSGCSGGWAQPAVLLPAHLPTRVSSHGIRTRRTQVSPIRTALGETRAILHNGHR